MTERSAGPVRRTWQAPTLITIELAQTRNGNNSILDDKGGLSNKP
jgi:hypothetical protein